MKHFRMILSLVLALVMVAGFAVPAFAEDASVTYEGNAGEFIFEPGTKYSPTDLFPNFKNVMPGDKITQMIDVRNDPAKGNNVIIYMRALGAEEGSEDFLSQLKLTVKPVAGDANLFEAPADQTDGLTEWKSLGTFEPGASITLEVTLEVPIELGNEYMNSIGYLDWEFAVEEFESPKTGDTNNFHWEPYAAVIACCVLLLAVVLVVRKRKLQED